MEQLIDFHAPEVQAVLDTLLKDKSTGKNIIWATDPPEELQTVMYEPVTDRSQITTQQLGLTHYEVVLPRMMKQTDTQQQRTRKKGEVFSPAWVCNKMDNALDADWFGALGASRWNCPKAGRRWKRRCSSQFARAGPRHGCSMSRAAAWR